MSDERVDEGIEGNGRMLWKAWWEMPGGPVLGPIRHNLWKIDVCEIPSTRYRCSSEALLCLRNAVDLPQASSMASFTHGRWIDRINPASACVYSVSSGARHFFLR
jgi:hypothetical protein